MQRITPRGPRGLLQRIIFFFTRRMFGRVPSSVGVWAHHRKIFAGASMMEGALSRARAVPVRTHALVDLAAAREIGCRYCLDIGSWVGMQKGLAAEDLAALDEAERSPCFSEAERAAIALAQAMSQTPPEVDDALFERVRRHYDEEQIVELVSVIGWEQFRARINHAVGLVPEGFLQACPIPSPARAPIASSLTPPTLSAG